MVILRFPHLVLADVSDDDRFSASFLPEIVDYVRGVEMPIVWQALNVAHRGVALQFLDMREPRAAVWIRDVRSQLLKGFACIADESRVHLDVFVDFRAVNFNVNLARAFRVSAQVAGNAVIETHPDSDKQVGLLNRMINPSLTMHAHHAEIHRIGSREAADAEQSHGNGNVAGAHELLKRAHRTRK